MISDVQIYIYNLLICFEKTKNTYSKAKNPLDITRIFNNNEIRHWQTQIAI